MERISLTEAEVIDALRQASQTFDGDGITIQEIRDKTGWSILRARNIVKAQIKAKKMEPCRVPREAMDGRTVSVSGYRWVG